MLERLQSTHRRRCRRPVQTRCNGQSLLHRTNHRESLGQRQKLGPAVSWSQQAGHKHSLQSIHSRFTALTSCLETDGRPSCYTGKKGPTLQRLYLRKGILRSQLFRSYIHCMLLHRKTHLPRGWSTSRIPPCWLLRRGRPCRAPALRFWSRKRRIRNGRLWMKSD